jgi:hypothetical protein
MGRWWCSFVFLGLRRLGPGKFVFIVIFIGAVGICLGGDY